MRLLVATASVLLVAVPTHSFVVPSKSRPLPVRRNAKTEDGQDAPIDLKAELTAYLEKRKQVNADEEAKGEVGKVVGGTKGNLVLEYVSGSPNKEFVIEEEPNIFDYDQLSKYGYGHLVTPIMDAGGRLEMYELMDMQAPAMPTRLKPKSAPKLVIDRSGENDPARYTGLKMGQVLDDDAMGQALEEANRKRKEGKELRPRLMEEDYVQPFADKRNTGPRLTPDWTPEMLDEEGRKRGAAQAWAKRAMAGEFVKDPAEYLAVEGSLRVYSVLVAGLAAFAFGRATPEFMTTILGMQNSQGLQSTLQVPALILLLAAIGSSAFCAVALAPERNRSPFVWGVKGLFGGPIALSQLRGLDALLTQEETDLAKEK